MHFRSAAFAGGAAAAMWASACLAQSAPDPVPNATARGVGLVPGALVCADFRAVRFVFSAMSEAASDRLQDEATKGQALLLRHDRGSVDPHAFGCALLPPGTRIAVRMSMGFPIVTAHTEDGLIIGTTLSDMVVRDQ